VERRDKFNRATYLYDTSSSYRIRVFDKACSSSTCGLLHRNKGNSVGVHFHSSVSAFTFAASCCICRAWRRRMGPRVRAPDRAHPRRRCPLQFLGFIQTTIMVNADVRTFRSLEQDVHQSYDKGLVALAPWHLTAPCCSDLRPHSPRQPHSAYLPSRKTMRAALFTWMVRYMINFADQARCPICLFDPWLLVSDGTSAMRQWLAWASREDIHEVRPPSPACARRCFHTALPFVAVLPIVTAHHSPQQERLPALTWRRGRLALNGASCACSTRS
jgi:hypothetical protein